jgi:diguanylate cyclase (GGDEF)-like protein
MEIVAQQAATAVSNALKFEGTREDALTDGLTSLPNIRFLHLYLDQEMIKIKRYRTPLSLLVMDLDGFKSVNDTYGHQVGDRVLIEVSSIFKGEMRGSDVIVRLGGDEFVAVLPGAAQTDADVLIERIRAAIRDFKFVVAPGEVAGIGISIGSATCPEDGDNPETLLKAADEAMYRDKADRRSSPASPAPAATQSSNS